MTQEEKVALLKEARVWDVIGYPGCIDKLFDLVAAHEREKLISKVAPDGRVSKTLFTIDDISKASEQGYQAALVELEAAVLAEREACAKLCEEPSKSKATTDGGLGVKGIVGKQFAAAIRSRCSPPSEKN